MSALDELTRSFRKGHTISPRTQARLDRAVGAEIQQRQRELQGELLALGSSLAELAARYMTLMAEWQRNTAVWEHGDLHAREVSGVSVRR